MTIDKADGTVIARILGEVDCSNAKHLGDTIVTAGAQARACVVDLALVTYLDSAALAMLHRLAQQAAALHLVIPPDSRAARLVEICGLDTVLRTHQTIEDALAGL
ncbi:MAG: STAS domain-containing protein [Mycobacterium sp.]